VGLIIAFQDILSELFGKEGRVQEEPVGPRLLKSFSEQLKTRLEDCAKDPNVVGFKSVVCYRTGLDIPIGPNRPAAVKAMNGVYDRFRSKGKNEPLRLADKPLNDLVVRKTVRIAAQYSKPGMIPLFFFFIVPNTRSTIPRF